MDKCLVPFKVTCVQKIKIYNCCTKQGLKVKFVFVDICSIALNDFVYHNTEKIPYFFSINSYANSKFRIFFRLIVRKRNLKTSQQKLILFFKNLTKLAKQKKLDWHKISNPQISIEVLEIK